MTMSDIEALENDLEVARSQWLRRKGWEHRCDYPGALWLWSKKLKDGRLVCVDESTAFSIEQATMSERMAKAEFGEPIDG